MENSLHRKEMEEAKTDMFKQVKIKHSVNKYSKLIRIMPKHLSSHAKQ